MRLARDSTRRWRTCSSLRMMRQNSAASLVWLESTSWAAIAPSWIYRKVFASQHRCNSVHPVVSSCHQFLTPHSNGFMCVSWYLANRVRMLPNVSSTGCGGASFAETEEQALIKAVSSIVECSSCLFATRTVTDDVARPCPCQRVHVLSNSFCPLIATGTRTHCS